MKFGVCACPRCPPHSLVFRSHPAPWSHLVFFVVVVVLFLFVSRSLIDLRALHLGGVDPGGPSHVENVVLEIQLHDDLIMLT